MILLLIPLVLSLVVVLPWYISQELAWHRDMPIQQRLEREHRYYAASGQKLPEYWTRTVPELPAIRLKTKVWE